MKINRLFKINLIIFVSVLYLFFDFSAVFSFEGTEQNILYSELVIYSDENDEEHLHIDINAIITDIKGENKTDAPDFFIGRMSWAVTKPIGLSNSCEEGLCLIDIEGNNLKVVTDEIIQDVYLSPDGDWGLYSVNLDYDNPSFSIYIYDVISQKTQLVIDNLHDVSELMISPNKKYITYCAESRDGETSSLYIIDLQNNNRINLTPGINKIMGYSWAPDSETIYFSTFDTIKYTLGTFMISPDGKNYSQLFWNTELADFGIYLPAISPDGKKIALASVSGVIVFSFDENSGTLFEVDKSEEFIEEMYWSANGDFLLIRIPKKEDTEDAFSLNSNLYILDINNKLSLPDTNIVKIGEGIFPKWLPNS